MSICLLYCILLTMKHKLGEFLSAVLAIQSMVLLGFADDILDVRWRYKIWFPAVASIPLLIFYYTNFGVTHVVMPLQLRPLLGDLVDLGKSDIAYARCSLLLILLLYVSRCIILCIHADACCILHAHDQYSCWD